MTNVQDSHLKLFSVESLPACTTATLPNRPVAQQVVADIAVSVESVEPAGFGHRIESVLRASAELTGCHAAALYLLDDATSKLSLQQAYQMPAEVLVAAPRRLSESIADLEALSGSAVALEDNSLFPYWRVPLENCGAAVCVPVANASTILGTLWVFSDQARSFTANDIQLIEVIAGRIAADLCYESLCQETAAGNRLERQWSEAAQRQSTLLPALPTLPGGWEVAGWTGQAEGIGGAMLDWLCDEQDDLQVIVGQAQERGLRAAIGAASLSASLRLLSAQNQNPVDVLSAASKAIWSSSAGDQFAAAMVGSLNPFTGDLRYGVAGRMHAVLVGTGKNRRLALDAPQLGIDPELVFAGGKTNIAPGATMVICSEGAGRMLREGRRGAEARIAGILQKFRHQSLAEQVAAVARAAESGPANRPGRDAAILALHRPARS